MSRILVVDDEANIRMMIRMGLQAAGHEVETAADGEAALALFESGERFDLVLLDQRMPGLDGLAVLREIRGQHDPKARVVMVTAFGTIDLAREALQAGATDLLRKPFTLDVLRGAVQSGLEGRARVGFVDALESRAADGTAFDYATINGFRIASDQQSEAGNGASMSGGPHRYGFVVRDAKGGSHGCTVVLPHYFQELVKAHADRDSIEEPDFWRWLCEESLANFLWQNAGLPPHGVLQVEELSTGLRRWIDAVLAR